jgi:hypothetical protein
MFPAHFQHVFSTFPALIQHIESIFKAYSKHIQSTMTAAAMWLSVSPLVAFGNCPISARTHELLLELLSVNRAQRKAKGVNKNCFSTDPGHLLHVNGKGAMNPQIVLFHKKFV